ncbi:MAG: MarR family transcriptional regulator [Myxococcota bacterium]|nr:MarR family transcriptional regulator [Myxococcota bacterium]
MRSEAAPTPASGRSAPSNAASRYRENVARHLIGISRDLQGRVRSYLTEKRGYSALRPSFGPFLSLIWIEGRPLTAIASQLAISKQACSQLVNLGEDAGYVERKPDPQDRRSKLVVLTQRGHRLIKQAARVILASESEYAELVGPAAYRRFTASLAALYRGLGISSQVDPALAAIASGSIGVLPLISVRIQRDLMEATLARGHAGLKMSHGQVLPLIGPEGSRVHEIARIQRVSRQAVSATSKEIESLGYLRREPDPQDRRGVVLQLTGRGKRLIADSVAALDGLDTTFRETLGERRLAQLRQTAQELYEALHLEEEIFEHGPGRPAATGPTHRRRPKHRRHDIQGLATRLRRELGNRDTARLVALLEAGARNGAS